MSETRHGDLWGVDEISTLRERSDHEAGRYVMLRALGVQHFTNYVSVEAISEIGEKKAIGGVCSWFPFGPFNSDIDIIHGLGGWLAQIEGLRRRGEDTPAAAEIASNCASDDLMHVLKKYGEERVASYFGAVADLVSKNWGLITELSYELVEHRILYSDEPRLILDFCETGSPIHLINLKLYRDNRIEAPTRNVAALSFRKRHPTRAWYESLSSCLHRLRLTPPARSTSA